MPFVKRVVTPKYIARSSKLALQPYAAAPTIPVADNEFEALTNVTLSNALRQLASLVYISNQIFTELHQELSSVNERSLGIKQRIDRLSAKVDQCDPKQVTVVSSISRSRSTVVNSYNLTTCPSWAHAPNGPCRHT
uniref:Putative cytoskeletal regulator n=1 Tax=Anopheles gambiae TaxID=7165 RepID=Q8STG5_ANOGA|nr:putative cytoskeletal regulator [Anopheles gambiae]CAD27753.1 putative cytoskeletal regulator [Anopheles gambiae]